MQDKETMARMKKSTLVGLAKHKMNPTESYDSILARLLGLRKVPPPLFKIKKGGLK